MKILSEHIKNGTFSSLYLIYGEETFLKNSYKNQMKQSIIGNDTMNFSYFEGKGIDVNEVISLANTMPFFAEYRLILIENSGFFKSANDNLLMALKEIPESTILIFVENEVDKRGKLYKTVNELGYVSLMERQDTKQLARWAGGMLGKEGKKISVENMDYFLSLTGDDMEHIRMEIEKLISYTLGRDVIMKQDIDEICTVRVVNKIFDMITAIANKQTKKAMLLYEDLLTLKEPPMRILFLIARQFNQLLQVKELMKSSSDKAIIAKKLKLQPFIVGKVMLQAKQFTKEQMLGYVNLCVDTEEAVKTGKLQERLAVELLITQKI